MSTTLTSTSSMMSYLTLIETKFGALPTGDEETAAYVLLQQRIEETEYGHRDPATLVEIGMTLGRVEALADRHLDADHPLRGAILQAKQTLMEMIRTH